VTGTKVCSKCKVEKELEEFYKDKTRRDGLHNMCKECRDLLNAKWRAENPEKVRAYRVKGFAKWRAENPEKVKVSRAKWRAENPEKMREGKVKYRAENQEKIKVSGAKWRSDLPDSYVIQQLKNPNPPQELIELKRIQLRIHREVYKKGDAEA